jgi:hypothetical protein
MNSWGLGIIRPVPLDLEDAVGLSIFALVSPEHVANLDDTGEPVSTNDIFSFLPCFPISFGIAYKTISLKKVTTQNCKLFQILCHYHVTENVIKTLCVELQSCRCAMLQTVCYYRHKLKPIIY